MASSCELFGGAFWLSAREMVDPMQLFSALSSLRRPCEKFVMVVPCCPPADGQAQASANGLLTVGALAADAASVLFCSDFFCRKRLLTTSSPASPAGSSRAWAAKAAKLLARLNRRRLASRAEGNCRKYKEDEVHHSD